MNNSKVFVIYWLSTLNLLENKLFPTLRVAFLLCFVLRKTSRIKEIAPARAILVDMF